MLLKICSRRILGHEHWCLLIYLTKLKSKTLVVSKEVEYLKACACVNSCNKYHDEVVYQGPSKLKMLPCNIKHDGMCYILLSTGMVRNIKTIIQLPKFRNRPWIPWMMQEYSAQRKEAITLHPINHKKKTMLCIKWKPRTACQCWNDFIGKIGKTFWFESILLESFLAFSHHWFWKKMCNKKGIYKFQTEIKHAEW